MAKKPPKPKRTLQYEVWVGSPNAMTHLGVDTSTIPKMRQHAVKALRDWEDYCKKFDHAALGPLRHAIEEIGQITPQSFGASGRLAWEFPIANLPAYRIELKENKP